MTSFDTLSTYVTDANATLDDLQALLANLRGYGIVQFNKNASEVAGVGTYVIPIKLSLCDGIGLSDAITVPVSATSTGSPSFTLDTTSITFPRNSSDGTIQNVVVTITQANAGDTITLSLGAVTGAGLLGNYEVHTVTYAGGEWCCTFDFTQGELGWSPYPILGLGSFGATWTSAGWKPINTTSTGRYNRAAAIQIDIPVMTTLTEFSVNFDFVKGVFTTATEDAYVIEEFEPRYFLIQVDGGVSVTGNNQTITWNGSLTTDKNIGVTIRSSRVASGSPSGDCIIKRITIRGTGINPFESYPC